MRNFVFKFILVFLLFIFSFNICSFADDVDSEVFDDVMDTIEVSSSSNSLDSINSRAYVVIDRNSGVVLCGKNENQKRKMASTTKIMTATVVLENANLNDIVTVSKKAAGTGGSRLGLKAGDKLSVQDLLYGLLLCSGNDAAVALAEFVGGDIEGFANLMNEKAVLLGLNNTHFETPHGLDSNLHYTTAYELAVLTNFALENYVFSKIVGTLNYTVNINGYPKNIHNTNELLGSLDGVYGVKTGFTNGANRCLVTSCKRGDLDIICVVLGADTKKFRTIDSTKLINYVFSNFSVVNIKDLIYEEFENWKLKNLADIYINKSTDSSVSLVLSDLEYDCVPLENSVIDQLKVYVDCNMFLEAPLDKGVVVGKVCLMQNDISIADCDIVLNESVNRKNVFNYMFEFFVNFNDIVSSCI